MAKSKTTSRKAASNASKTLRDPSTGKKSKTAAGSALSQRDSKKLTSKQAASSASKVLREGRTSKKSKSAAGSTLSQREGGGKYTAVADTIKPPKRPKKK